MTQLVRYDEMRRKLAECARIDEVLEVERKADKLAAYARLMDDRTAEIDAAEIRDRARVRFGVLSGDLETAKPIGYGSDLPNGGKTKTETLSDVGVSTSTAHRYEVIAGGRDPEGRAAAAAKLETYFAETRAAGKPSSVEGMRRAIQNAVDEVHGGPPLPRQKREPDPVADDWIDLTARIKHLANATPDLEALAHYLPAANPRCLDEAKMARELLIDWITALQREVANGSRAA